MRVHHLLAPRRLGPPSGDPGHAGAMTTTRPDEMWTPGGSVRASPRRYRAKLQLWRLAYDKPWYARPAMTRNEIPTPALLLDLERFERNIAKMAAHVKAAGKKLRPHSKTHKCPEIARRQIAAGAVGICCAKVGEAEVMAAAGIRNILITTEVVGPEKIGRLLGVLEQAPETIAVVDNVDNVRELGQAMAAAGKVLNVLVDVDVGGRRTGTQPGEHAAHLARMVMLELPLNLRGLQS